MEEILYTFEFKVGDQVLAYYQGLLYKAIITKRKISDYGEIEYYIHYKGFKRSWDEWVDSDEVLAINDINLAHKERLEFNRKSCRKSRKQKKKNSASKSANGKRGRPKKSAEQTAGPASVQLKELTVKLTDILKFPGPYTTQFTKQATAQSTKPTVEKSAELDLHVISEPAVPPKRKKISQEPWKKDNVSSPKPKKRKRGGSPKKNAEKSSGQDLAKMSVLIKVQLAEPAIGKSAESVLLGCEKPATTPSPLLASENSTELTAEKSNLLLFVESIKAQLAEFIKMKSPGTTVIACEHAMAGIYFKLVSENNTELIAEELVFPLHSESGPAQLAELTVDKSVKSAIQSVTEPSTAQLAEPTTSQSVEQAIDNSAELNLETLGDLALTKLAGLSSTPLPELVVEESDFPLHSESDPAQLAELTVDKSTESAIQSVLELSTAQLAEPTTSQSVEQAIDNSAELNLETLGDLALTKLAGLSSTPLPELVVEESDFQKCADPLFALNTEPAVRSNRVKNSQEPWTTEDSSSLKPAKKKRATTQFVKPDIKKFKKRAVSLKQVKKSQEPWTTENAFSSKPLKRNRCSPKKNVKKSSSKFEEQTKSQYAETAIAQYVEPPITQCVEPAIEKSAESAIQSVLELSTAQLAEPTTSQSVEQAIDNSAELNLETLGDLALTKLAGLSSTPLPELVVEESDFQKCADPLFALNTEPAVRSNQVKNSQEPWTTEDSSSLKPAKKKRATTQFVKPDIKKFKKRAVRSKQVKKSQEPWTKNVKKSSSKFEEQTKSQYAETAIAQYVEPPITQCVEPAVEKSTESAIQSVLKLSTAQLAEPTTSQSVEQAIDNSAELNLETLGDLALTKLAGLSSTPLPELVVEESDFQKCADPLFALNTEPAVRSNLVKNSQEPWTTEDSSSLKPAKKKRATTQFVKPDIKKFKKRAVSLKQVKKSQEPWTTENAFSSKPLKRNRCSPKKNVKKSSSKFEEQTKSQYAETAIAQYVEPPITQCVEPAVEKSTESAIQSVLELSTAQLAEPTTSQSVEQAIDNSAELNLETLGDLALTKLAGLSSTPLPELVVEESDFQKCADPLFALNTEPAVRSNRVKNSQEPWTTEDSSSLKPAKKKRATTQFVKPDIKKFKKRAVSLKQVKKSQEPWTTENAFSSKPLKRNRCSPKKNVKKSSSKFEEQTKSQYAETAIAQYVEPPITQCVEPAIEKSAESAIQSVLELSTAQLAEPTTSQSVEPVVGESIAIEENEEDVRAAENIVINIVPFAKPYAIKLFKKLNVPPVLKRVLEFDRIMHTTFHKTLKFQNNNFVANIIYIFTNSSYFTNDDQNKISTTFSVTLLKLFNNYVNDCLTYLIERKACLQKKGLEHFRDRMGNRPNISYALKGEINPKTIWCYVYGPIYLLRLIEALPNILLSNIWLPDYSIESFVDHVIELTRFLADNMCTYFINTEYNDPVNVSSE